jgi:hypothetical protein
VSDEHELYLIEDDDCGRPPITRLELRCRCQDDLSDFDRSKLREKIYDTVTLTNLIAAAGEHGGAAGDTQEDPA